MPFSIAWAYLILHGEEALEELRRKTEELLGSDKQSTLDDVGPKIKLSSGEETIRIVAESLQQQAQGEEKTSDEEPEWDDDDNPWLGCICGETHAKPTPVFWIQCDSCDAWYNCAPACIGFDKTEALHQNEWVCPSCKPEVFDQCGDIKTITKTTEIEIVSLQR